jgi:hypothetical protein
MVSCECPRGYTGLYCNLKIVDSKINDYIGNAHFLHLVKSLKAINFPFTRQEIFIMYDLLAIQKTNPFNPGLRQQVYEIICKDISLTSSKAIRLRIV